MKLSELEKKLLAAARTNPPDDRVPHAFAKRITALVAACPAPDRWALWSQALWRGAAGCLAVMLLLGAGALYYPKNTSSTGDLSQEFENTMLASADQDADNIW